MPIAVVVFRFDPIAHLFGDLAVRWGVLALAGALIAALVACGRTLVGTVWPRERVWRDLELDGVRAGKGHRLEPWAGCCRSGWGFRRPVGAPGSEGEHATTGKEGGV